MTQPRLRALPAVLLAVLGAGCGGHSSSPPAALCQLPSPRPSALPTLPTVAGPGQSQAIHLGVRTAGEMVTFAVPDGTASVTIVEQAASPANALVVLGAGFTAPNTPVPLSILVSGNPTPIFFDVPMPPDAAFRKIPAGTGITVLDPVSDPNLPVYFFSEGAWTGALTMPNTTEPIPGTVAPAGVPAGTWTVQVSDWSYECRTYPTLLGCSPGALANSLYDVTVILKPVVASPPNALNVVFYLVTSSALSATNAGSNPDMVRLQWAVTHFLQQAGINPSFSFVDVPPAVRMQYATGVDANSGGVCGTMDQLLQLAGPGNQLNVFLVDLIKDSSNTGTFFTVGLDPIVPGAASFGGTPASGVLVSLVDLGKGVSPGCVAGTLSLASCGDDRTAFVVAHEAGHYMGLYHTTESIGTIVDPIADTATCFCPQCRPSTATRACQGVGVSDPVVASPYQMLVTDCLTPSSNPPCGGGDDLMFWLLDANSQGLLTPGQAAVMLGSPLVE